MLIQVNGPPCSVSQCCLEQPRQQPHHISLPLHFKVIPGHLIRSGRRPRPKGQKSLRPPPPTMATRWSNYQQFAMVTTHVI